MPCWEVRTMSVEFKAKHCKLLEQAIEFLGWKYENIASGLRVRTGEWWNDSFTIHFIAQEAVIQSTQQSLLNQLKQQYSREALKRAARLRGWQFKQQGQQLQGVLRK